MTEEEARAEIGTKAIKFIDEHEKDCLTGFEMMREFAYEVTKDLEKENAELKAFKEKCKFNVSDIFEGIEIEKQLIKAKEIIRDFIAVAIDYIDKEDKNYFYIAEAEKFLKEIEG